MHILCVASTPGFELISTGRWYQKIDLQKVLHISTLIRGDTIYISDVADTPGITEFVGVDSLLDNLARAE